MNLLVTGAWQQAENNVVTLQNMGHEVRFLPCEKDELPCDYEWVEGIICNGLFLYHPIERFCRLKYIQLTSAGMDRVPMEYVRKNHISIYNAKGVYSIPMAEFVVAGILELYKQLIFFANNQQKHNWEKNRNLLELAGKKICIIGCGSVGTECAKRFRAFECEITGVDLFPVSNSFYDEIVGLDELYKVLPNSDIVILTLPLTENTLHFMDEEKISRMKDGAILVNIARGAVVDSLALISALETKLGGAVLDVFEEEPLKPDDRLWNMKNVIVTPHNSFVGDGNQRRLRTVILDNLIRVN